jgi:riboflavin-specific deaminase-like protein
MARKVDRPFVWANCALSLDGRLAYANGRPAPLSGPEDLARVQGIRAAVDAILVGSGTVLADDPSLRVHWELLGRTPSPALPVPARVILDSRGRVRPPARVLDGSIRTVVFTSRSAPGTGSSSAEQVRLGERNVPLPGALRWLYRNGLRSLLVEGGTGVMSSFLRGGWVDRFSFFVAPVLLGEGSSPALFSGPPAKGPRTTLGLKVEGSEPLDGGVLIWGRPRRVRPGAASPPKLGPEGRPFSPRPGKGVKTSRRPSGRDGA